MRRVHHRYATLGGQRLFYREAGSAGALAFADDAPCRDLPAGWWPLLAGKSARCAAGTIRRFLDRTLS
jgi:hypothetical protein